MTALPAASDFTGSTRTEGQVKAALNDLRAFLADLFGTDGLPQTALETLGVPGARTTNITANTSVTAADRGRILRVTAAVTVTLPALASVPVGFSVLVRCSAGGTATVNAAGSDLIAGVGSVTVRPLCWLWLSAMSDQWVSYGTGGAVDAFAGTASAPGIYLNGDSNTGLFWSSADVLGFTAGGTQRALLSTTALTMAVPVLAASGSAGAPGLSFSAEATMGLFRQAAGVLGVAVGGNEVARFTSSGRLALGISTLASRLHVAGESGTDSQVTVQRASDDGLAPTLFFRKSRGTLAAPALAQSGNNLGTLNFAGFDNGTTFSLAAQIQGVADADHAAGSVPGRVVISTTPAASTTPVERMRVDANGAAVTGRLAVNGGVAWATSVVIADDAVATLTPGRTGGLLILTCGGGAGAAVTDEAACGIVSFDIGTTLASIEKGGGFTTRGSLLDVSTALLTGTTGTDGRVTVSARNNGTLLVENRFGSAKTFTAWVF